MDTNNTRRRKNSNSDSEMDAGLSNISQDIVAIGLDNLTKKFKVKTNRIVRERSNSAPAKMPKIEDCQFSWSISEDRNASPSSDLPQSISMPQFVPFPDVLSQNRSRRGASFSTNASPNPDAIASSTKKLPGFQQFCEIVNQKSNISSAGNDSSSEFGNISLDSTPLSTQPMNTQQQYNTTLSPRTNYHHDPSIAHNQRIDPISQERNPRLHSPSTLAFNSMFISPKELPPLPSSPPLAGAVNASSISPLVSVTPYSFHPITGGGELQTPRSVNHHNNNTFQFPFQPAPFLFRPMEQNKDIIERYHQSLKNGRQREGSSPLHV